MKCHEARSRVGPYLDSELDTEMSLKMEQHLESCPDCRRVFEAETHLESRIQNILCEGSATRDLWEKAEAQLELDVAPERTFSAHRFLRFNLIRWGAAAAVIVVLFIVFWRGGKERPLDLAVVSAAHHQEYLDHQIAAQFSGMPPHEIIQKLNGELDPKAFTYTSSKPPYEYRGARLCYLKGVPSAMIFGDCRNVPVSLLVFKKTDLAHFPIAQQKLETGEPIVCSHVGHYQFAARFMNDYVVCAIGDIPKSSLEDFLKSVTPSI